MAFQKVFKNNYIKSLEERIIKGEPEILELYEKDHFPIEDENCLIDARLTIPDEIMLILPQGENKHNLENAKIIFEIYKDLPLIKASDPGLWTYLTHGTFWKYTRTRWPIEQLKPNIDKSSYILEHWFVKNVGAPDLARNAISSLWWGCYLTYDKNRENPYELTEQLFSMLDFYRTIIAGVQGRNAEFTHAILEYILERPDLFSAKKEGKVRLLMRRVNAIGGYKLFTSLSKDQIKEIFKSFDKEIAAYLGD
jgi:hypothetical protein